MEENYNLDDFFKNKFDDLTDDGTDWDRPRGNAWTQARQQLATQSLQRWKRKAVVGGVLLGILCLLTATYGVYLQRNIVYLEGQLAQKEQLIQQQYSELQTLRANCANPPLAKTPTPVAPLPPPISTTVSKTIPAAIISVDTALVVQLRDSLQLLRQLLQEKEQTESPAALTPPPIAFLPSKTLSPLTSDNALNPLPSIQMNALESTRNNAPFQRFEVGVKLSFLPYSIPISSSVANVGSIQGESEDLEAVTDVLGLQFGYGIRPNLYLRSGLRIANLELGKTIISGIIYDKTGEFTQANGTVANNILLENRTSFSDIDQEITVEIPAGTELESGDLLLMTLTNYQTIDFIQIPLGISYFQGKKRWQMEYLGGLIYNYVGIGNYQLQADFQANNIEIPVDDIRITSNEVAVSQFLTAYAGVGVSYRLSHHWQARSNLTIEDNTHDFDSKRFFRFNDVGVGLNFSLNYRF